MDDGERGGEVTATRYLFHAGGIPAQNFVSRQENFGLIGRSVGVMPSLVADAILIRQPTNERLEA
jgi:hypothetical protein